MGNYGITGKIHVNGFIDFLRFNGFSPFMRPRSSTLAVEFLGEYLKNSGTTQADFASAAKMDQSTISDILKGLVSISGKNLPKLLKALPAHTDKLSFLAAYLRDQVPPEHTDEVSIEVNLSRLGGAADGVVCEVDIDPKRVWLEAATNALGQLPQQTQEHLFHLAKALRHDAELREVFKGLMRYVPRAPSAPVPHAPIAPPPGFVPPPDASLGHTPHPLGTGIQKKAAARPKPPAGR